MNQISDIDHEVQRQHLQPIVEQTKISQKILTHPIQQQLQILNQEIDNLENNDDLTNNQKQYYKLQYQQQLFTKGKDLGEVKSIPHVKQNIEASNPELAFYVLKESLLRDQNRELLSTSQQYSFGIDSILGAYGQDQSCLKVRNTNLDYDKIVNDNQLLEHHILEFKQKLSSSLNISIDQIEVLGVSKGSFEINFQITGNNMYESYYQIKHKPEAQKFLNEYCNGKIEYLAYFDQASNCSKGVALSSEDFNPQFNMSWDNFQEKEQRGPPYHKYDYYFPRGCYGFGLNVKNYRNDDWIKKDGNPNEWRIMYHSTQQQFVSSIVKCNLKPGANNVYSQEDCLDEFGNTVKVGNGIYFSDRIDVFICNGYANYTQIGNKQFAVIFMSRVNPKKIRQSEHMRNLSYFLVNESKDVRPYRILLHEKKSSSLNISIDQIEVLGVSKGSFEINFQITGNNMYESYYQIKHKPEAQKFLNEYCNGKIEYLAYFDQASNCSKGVALSSEDFNPQFNMSWDNFQEKEQRGPPYHKYDYYFPRGCYGFGLNVKKYGNDDWIKKDGNPNEWRIMYHSTQQQFVSSIVKCNLKPGYSNAFQIEDCLDEFGNTVKVGNGIYFSDRIDVFILNGYTKYTQIGNKQFAVIFMSRVNPKKIRQSEHMRNLSYFLVNESKDVRPYRILLHEKK